MSYRGRPPLSNLPVVVLCGHESSSNAEIFTHAFKELKQRGDECDNTEQLQIWASRKKIGYINIRYELEETIPLVQIM